MFQTTNQIKTLASQISKRATGHRSGHMSGEAALQVSDAHNFLGLLRRQMDSQRLPGEAAKHLQDVVLSTVHTTVHWRHFSMAEQRFCKRWATGDLWLGRQVVGHFWGQMATNFNTFSSTSNKVADALQLLAT